MAIHAQTDRDGMMLTVEVQTKDPCRHRDVKIVV